MPNDARQHERFHIRLEELGGNFRLFTNNLVIQGFRVNDVSAAGAGLVVTEHLNPGSRIKLSFVSGDWEVTVQGEVIWCTAARVTLGHVDIPHNYRVGLRFDPADAESNLSFFRASKSSQTVVN